MVQLEPLLDLENDATVPQEDMIEGVLRGHQDSPFAETRDEGPDYPG